MFEVKDSKGVGINIKDTVSFQTTQVDFIQEEGEDCSGMVIGFPREGMVLVQHAKGAPFEVVGESVTVTESLIGEILSLRDDTKFQEVLERAEERYNKALEVEKSKGKRGKGKGTGTGKKASAAKPRVTGTLDLGAL